MKRLVVNMGELSKAYDMGAPAGKRASVPKGDPSLVPAVPPPSAPPPEPKPAPAVQYKPPAPQPTLGQPKQPMAPKPEASPSLPKAAGGVTGELRQPSVPKPEGMGTPAAPKPLAAPVTQTMGMRQPQAPRPQEPSFGRRLVMGVRNMFERGGPQAPMAPTAPAPQGPQVPLEQHRAFTSRPEVANAFASSAKEKGLSAPVMQALGIQESGYNADAVSRSGARGYGQFMPGTRNEILRKYGVDAWSRDPVEATRASAAYMSDIGKNFTTPNGVNHALMLAGYNAGPASVYSPNGWIPGARTPTHTLQYNLTKYGGYSNDAKAPNFWKNASARDVSAYHPYQQTKDYVTRIIGMAGTDQYGNKAAK